MNEPINIEEWTVHRFYDDLRRVTIVQSPSQSLAPWLAKLRQLLPEMLSGKAPSEMLEEVRKSGRIELGTLDGRIAWSINQKLSQHGYEVALEDVSRVGYLPVQLIGGQQMALIIEDEGESEAFSLDLIARGASVVPMEG
jgi:hypothetical protein